MANLMDGKVAIVTGGARGIGRSVSLALAAEGAHVVVADIGVSLGGEGEDVAPAREMADEIIAAGGRAVASTHSITDYNLAEKIVETAIAEFGRIDSIVHCAGILRDSFFHKMSAKDWQDVLDVHLTGAFNICRAAAPHLKEQQSGSIVLMTSTAGLIGSLAQANYSAAKIGLVGLARSISLDMERFNVRANCIAPFAWSRMLESIPVKSKEDVERTNKLRQMSPETVAALAVFLCSDASSHIAGQIFAARRNEIFLFSQPRPIRSLHRSDGWTPENLASQLKGAFDSSLTPLERTPAVFKWDPI